jgi:Fic family protein
MKSYIYQLPGWPSFQWDKEVIAKHLVPLRHRQGRLLGRMEGLGMLQRKEASLQSLTLDVLKSSEIEGEILNAQKVRSSIARRLGMDIAGLVPSDRHVDGVVEMVLDATQNFDQPLNAKRLFAWHTALFPGGTSGFHQIKVGAWRDDASGPMQVVSGAIGHERVHFEAPAASRLDAEMDTLITWANTTGDIDPVLKAAIIHLWFVTIHPFDDGNGRIARAIADWALARSEKSSLRFYSMSSQIRLERNVYYDVLEKVQVADLDITGWLQWFLACLERAFDRTDSTLSAVLHKTHFWEAHKDKNLNERQRIILNNLLEDFEGKLTSTKWAKLAKCSQDTAQRDIADLVRKNILVKDAGGGRSTSYSLVETASI